MAGRRGRKPATESNEHDSDSGDNNSHAAAMSGAESDTYGGNTKQISAQEEADLSSALIAKLLAEDSGGFGFGGGDGHYASYYDDYSNNTAYGDTYDNDRSGSEADEDWDPNRKRSRAMRAGKGRKEHPYGGSGGKGAGGSGDTSGSDGSDGETRKKQRRSKKTPSSAKKERPPPPPVDPGQYRTGGYTEEEEAKFSEGLELYGRSWSEISAHVGTRDSKSIRSHAQKYFIKLFRDNVPLPDKVKETGDGYTLSGRPLDPNSAAARPYLQHVMQLDPPPSPKAKKVETPGKRASISNSVTESEAMPNRSAVEATSSAVDAADSAIPSENANVPEATADKHATNSVSVAELPLPKSPVRTEYAMSRPQRNNARTLALNYDDPHQMVRCTPFQGLPLSGTAGCQPFKLIVHTNAQLQMDFHAHLMLSEVIGLLGGMWDTEAKVLTVVRAFPCEALESEEAHTNVEMDPGSELVVRHQIMEAGLRVVGWYHSHPTFRPDPSIIDIENQTAYQKLFRDNGSAEEPFVGAIVGPYDPELPGPVSVFNWFYVGRSAVDRGHPKRLVVDTSCDAELPKEEHGVLLQLLDSAHQMKHHALLEEAWRPSSTELRSLKMVVSLAYRMPWLKARSAGKDDAVATHAPLAADVESASTAVSSEKPSPSDSGVDVALGDGTSDCSVSEPTPTTSTPAEDSIGDMTDMEKHIPAACLRAGQSAVQDLFLSALCSRFSVGIFKPGSDGKIADPIGLERVYAAYFKQWNT
ncbi:hypothetical protein LPJ53_002233 [Coemansia erecta]|uniref:Myb-like, SWIRM and MPN domain-containing protein 1 n=1 Tax=Coemansia erecta TaxID=147472 RepID=A0A9W7Y391_9FUNG|nr:hypothetical protein LPJ53_002233 [Coemansia erecta]